MVSDAGNFTRTCCSLMVKVAGVSRLSTLGHGYHWMKRSSGSKPSLLAFQRWLNASKSYRRSLERTLWSWNASKIQNMTTMWPLTWLKKTLINHSWFNINSLVTSPLLIYLPPVILFVRLLVGLSADVLKKLWMFMKFLEKFSFEGKKQLTRFCVDLDLFFFHFICHA